MDPTTLHTLADKVVKARLAQIEGVGRVDLGGGREREVRVELGRADVFDRSVPLLQIAGLLQAANVEIPGGSFKEDGQDLSVRLKGQFQSIDDIRNLDVPTRSGIVKLRQIADVRDSYKEVRERIMFFDKSIGRPERRCGAPQDPQEPFRQHRLRRQQSQGRPAGHRERPRRAGPSSGSSRRAPRSSGIPSWIPSSTSS